MKKIVKLLMTICLLSSTVLSIGADSKSITNSDKERMKHEIAFIFASAENVVFPSENINVEEISDDELLIITRTNLESAIAQNNGIGRSVFWNKDYVETVIKNYYPDLYAIIHEEGEFTQNDLQFNEQINPKLRTRGSISNVVRYYSYNTGSTCVQKAKVTMTWSWNDYSSIGGGITYSIAGDSSISLVTGTWYGDPQRHIYENGKTNAYMFCTCSTSKGSWVYNSLIYCYPQSNGAFTLSGSTTEVNSGQN